MIIIDGQNVETVCYWLTVVSEAGPVIAEGSISGSERVMRKIKNAKVATLTLMEAPQLRYNATVVETGRAGWRCRYHR